MEGLDRRSALSLGLAASAIPLLALARPAKAEVAPDYSPTDGEEAGPGVRWIAIGSRPSHIPAYASIDVIDVIFQPGAVDPPEGAEMPPMDVDMMCFITAGTFTIAKDGEEPFEVKAGDFYSCGKGTMERVTNIGSDVGIHRIAMLMPA
jgi:quercetin dioxygenase-like cupin family protein